MKTLLESAIIAMVLWAFGYFVSLLAYLSFQHYNPLLWDPPWRVLLGLCWLALTLVSVDDTIKERNRRVL